MTPRRDQLDEIIDRTAAQLVSIEPDDRMVGRIVDRLPDRRSPATRFVLAWLPQCAAVAAIVVAVVIWNRDPASVPASDPDVPSAVPPPAPAATPGASAPHVAEATMPARRAVARPSRVEETRVDHERSLAFVEEPDLLTLPSIAAPPLEPQDALNVAPLVLAELPLSGESNSPR